MATASPATACTRVVRTSVVALNSCSAGGGFGGCWVNSHGPPQSTNKTRPAVATPASAQSRYLGATLRHIAIGSPKPASFNGIQPCGDHRIHTGSPVDDGLATPLLDLSTG